MTIRFAEPHEYPDVLAHYQACNYGGGVNDSDTVIIAVDEEIAGAVRICTEHGVKVLRGMQVKSAYQRKGLGRSILQYLTEHLDMAGCYCLPYTHLKKFYGIIGFEEISKADAPVFLAERFEKYLSSGQQLTIMKRDESN
jgi:N-acetylglutamate synthase-like GNAT family acetyltransferase